MHPVTLTEHLANVLGATEWKLSSNLPDNIGYCVERVILLSRTLKSPSLPEALDRLGAKKVSVEP